MFKYLEKIFAKKSEVMEVATKDDKSQKQLKQE